MIKKALLTLAALSAIASAAAVAIVAAAFALFALLTPYVGDAGAAAIVAAIAAVIVAIGGLIAALKIKSPRHVAPVEDTGSGLTGKLFALAKQKPLLATGAAVAVGIIALRNPKLLTALLTGVLAGKAAPKN